MPANTRRSRTKTCWARSPVATPKRSTCCIWATTGAWRDSCRELRRVTTPLKKSSTTRSWSYGSTPRNFGAPRASRPGSSGSPTASRSSRCAATMDCSAPRAATTCPRNPWIRPRPRNCAIGSRRRLNRLPLEQRLTMELAYHMGHSIDEIAEITDCPAGTVKARMFHARDKLRHFLPALGGVRRGRPIRQSKTTMNTSHPPTAEHRDIWELLPWHVNGRLSEPTAGASRRICACAMRAVTNAPRSGRSTRSIAADTGVEQMPMAGLNKLRQRIERTAVARGGRLAAAAGAPRRRPAAAARRR